MNKPLCISILILLSAAGCNKDFPNPKLAGETLPFENTNIKLELISSTVPSNIRGINFFNASTGIAISYDGKIYKTVDSGVTWTIQYSNPITDQPFYQILFTDSNVGYVVGGSTSCGGTGCVPAGGLILKTTDGGNSWARVLQLNKVSFTSISVNNSGDLFAISNGTKGRIHKSINKGTSWITTDSTDFLLDKITFTEGYGFCTGKYGKIMRSSNGGNTWELAATLDANFANEIKFNSGNGYCIADNQTVYKTIDNGNTWTEEFHSDFQTYILNPVTSDNCLAFGSGRSFGDFVLVVYGAIRQSTNSGKDWIETEFQDLTSIRYTSFFSESEGYANSGTKMIKVTVK